MINHDHYAKIAKAIEYIQANFKTQPSLHEIAAHVHLSPTHFQRVFTEWAGISPKKFLQYLSLEHAKSILKSDATNQIFEATFETGLSSTSRLHDLFIKIEGMSPAEYRDGGRNLLIRYTFAQTLFGSVLMAATNKGICHIAFISDKLPALQYLQAQFPNATYLEEIDSLQSAALSILQSMPEQLPAIKLHLKGTDFQLKVWESLLKIPLGSVTTYRAIAERVGNENASRAVGSAIGKNPIAFLIPCHRVIQTSGNLGGYMWGLTRKSAILGWESAQCEIDRSKHAIIQN